MRSSILLGVFALSVLVAPGCGSEDPPATSATDTGVADTASTDTGAVIDTGLVADTGGATETGTTETGTTETGAETGNCVGTLPTAYESASFATNAAQELALRTAFKNLTDPMKTAEKDNTAVTADLKALLAAGTPSLKSIATTYYAGKVEGWLDAFVAAATKTYTPTDPPPAEGGRMGAAVPSTSAWFFDAKGTDLRQRVEKGLFAAAFYEQANKIAADKGTLTEASIDRLVALYGSTPEFPHDAMTPTTADTWVAVYAKRRDDKTKASGFYRSIKTSLITAKAAIAKSCPTDRDAALKSFVVDYEKVELATVLFYLNDIGKKLGSGMAADVAPALHALGEVYGFIHGFRGTATKHRKITDAQIDELLTLLLSPHDGGGTTYKYATDFGGQQASISSAITKITAIYGFTAAEVEAFKTNY